MSIMAISSLEIPIEYAYYTARNYYDDRYYQWG